MPLHKVQRGELSDRLRRFFGIVGNYAPQLEAIVNPVALVQDLSAPPFRLNAIGWIVGASQVAGAGQQSEIHLANSGSQLVILDELIISTAAAAGEACFIMQGIEQAVGTLTDAISMDAQTISGPFAPTVPVRLRSFLVPAGPSTTVVASVVNVPAPTSGALRVPLGWTLPPNQGAGNFVVGVRSSSVNQSIRVHAIGRIITDESLALR